MSEMSAAWSNLNFISIAIAAAFLVSVVQGVLRGGSGSARRLVAMLTDGLIALISIYAAWKGVQLVSPLLQAWLKQQNLQIPAAPMGMFKQLYYTMVTSVRDFPLLRFGVLFLIGYVVIKQLLHVLLDPLLRRVLAQRIALRQSAGGPTLLSSTAGAALGAVVGAARALMLIAVLFIFVTFFPHTPVASYIQASQMYQKGAEKVIAPFTGDFLAEKAPVFTRAVEQEFGNILQRKYEVLDANIPDDISAAAREVTAAGTTDEDKARLLYQWVGTRVQYDWDKVNLYEQQRIWREQTPEDTFATRKGVCIDYSRLYAVMARSVGLDVKVVTGLGYDGQGSYGPHAWNEVYLKETDSWVPLDSTWVASGGNWFNPPNFDQTHIKEA